MEQLQLTPLDAEHRRLNAKKRLLDILFLGSIAAAIGAFLFCQIWDYDIWWHIAIGKEIIASRDVPRLDQFAAAALGRPYHDSHWLFQVAAATAHQFGQMVGVQLLAVAIWSVTLFFSYKSIARWLPCYAAAVVMLLLAMACMERFIPRPEIITYLMIAIFYYLLQKQSFRTVGGLALLTTLQVVWTNSHGLFVLGPFMAGCSWLAAAAGRARGEEHPALAPLTLLLLLLLIATVATPYGIDNWRYAYLLFTEVGKDAPFYLRNIGELGPTFSKDTAAGLAFWFYLALLLGSFGAVVAAAWSRRISVERLLMVIAFLLLSLSGRRNMVLFALTAAPFLGENLYPHLHAKLLQRQQLLKAVVIPLCAALAFFSISGKYYRHVSLPARFGLGATPLVYPYGLPAFLQRIDYRGQVFNSNILGGFFLYHEYPRMIPLTDGRWEIYDPKLFDTDVPSLVKRFNISAFLLQHSCPDAREIYPELFRSSQWRLVYYDHTSSFWLKADSMPAVPTLDVSSPQSLPPPSTFIENYLDLENFLRHAGTTPARLTNLEQALQLEEAPEPLFAQLGTLQLGSGALAAAEQTFNRLLSRFPQNRIAYNGLAYIAAERGDLAAAEAVLLRGLKALPDNPELTANLQKLRAYNKNGSGQTRSPQH